jgi:hypothetical protein
VSKDGAYYIVGRWFGWWWDDKDASILADILEDGLNAKPHSEKTKHRIGSVINEVRKIAKEGKKTRKKMGG